MMRPDSIVCRGYDEVSLLAAAMLARQIRRNPASVLGLPTGSTPTGMYHRLAEMHRREGLDFSRVRTFNLDEYYPMEKGHSQSYHRYMWENLFSRVNANPENVHIPNGECGDPEKECADYERLVAEAGGADIQVLGIGVDGHIGFNEAGRELRPATHLADLSPSTREANARFFGSLAEVPAKAITMGMGTIMQAKSILLLISGEGKAPVAKKFFSGAITTDVPATLLHLHRDVTVILDEAAAALL